MEKIKEEFDKQMERLAKMLNDLREQINEPKCECGEYMICPVCQSDVIADVGQEAAKDNYEARKEAED